MSARQIAPSSEQWRDDVAASTRGHFRSCPIPARLGVAIHEQLLAAVDGRRGVEAADRLCEACVVHLEVDAAAISLIFDGASSGTLGSSSPSARVYDELQFTFGEGPCLEAVTRRIPIVVLDLADPEEVRWPAYGPAMLAHRIRGVWAMPVIVAGEFVGALDLFRERPGPMAGEDLAGAVAAAELAGIPLLDLMDGDLRAATADPSSNAWLELNALSRAEVSQATGVLVAQLGVEPAEALVRLRAHAFTTGRSATDVARDILDRRLTLDAD
jgi:GAF domain-containing protein/ANTAR domain-containing protein